MNEKDCLPSDQELVERTLAGDLDSYGMLYQKYRRLVLRHCMTILDGDAHVAEELTQEAYIIALGRLRDLARNKPIAFKAYVLRIAANLALDKKRRRKRKPKVDFQWSERNKARDTSQYDPTETVQWQELCSRLYKAISKIPDKLTRHCVIDRYIDEIPRNDICRAYSLTTNHLDHLLRKGREFIRKELEGHG